MPAPPPPLPDATGHALGPDGYRIRKGSDRPMGFNPTPWNMIGASGRAKQLAGLRVLEEAKLRAAAGGPGGGEASTASGGAGVVVGSFADDASAASGGAGVVVGSVIKEAKATSGDGRVRNLTARIPSNTFLV